MNFEVYADGVFFHTKGESRCALGRGGVAPMGAKREGDGATPAGLWPLRRLFYRPDRLSAPKTRLPVAVLKPTDGWCDAPGDPAYNQAVTLPYPASAEHLPGADASTGLRNVLYAFQWWVFGAFAIFMWWRWLQEDVLGRGRPGTATGGG